MYVYALYYTDKVYINTRQHSSVRNVCDVVFAAGAGAAAAAADVQNCCTHVRMVIFCIIWHF